MTGPNPLSSLGDTAKTMGDALSVGGVIAVLLSWLPNVAAILTIIWFALRIVTSWQEYKLNRRKLNQ